MAEGSDGERRKRGKEELLSSYLQQKGPDTVKTGKREGDRGWYVPTKPFPYRRTTTPRPKVPERRIFGPHGMGAPRVMRHGPDTIVKVSPWGRPARTTEPIPRQQKMPATAIRDDGESGPAFRDEMIRSMVRRRSERLKDEVTLDEVDEKAKTLPLPKRVADYLSQPAFAPKEEEVVEEKPGEKEEEEKKDDETKEEGEKEAMEEASPGICDIGPLPADVRRDLASPDGDRCESCGASVGPRNEPVTCASCGKRTCSECGSYDEVHRRSPITHEYHFEGPLCYDCYMRAYETQLAIAKARMCFGNGNMAYAMFYSKKALETGTGTVYEKEIKDLITVIERYQERSAVYEKHWAKKREHLVRQRYSDPSWK